MIKLRKQKSYSTLPKTFGSTAGRDIAIQRSFTFNLRCPRSLGLGLASSVRASPRAYPVIDDQQLFLTSANFTEAAHHRNIEAGVLMFDPVAARGLRSQIDILVAQKVFHRVPGL